MKKIANNIKGITVEIGGNTAPLQNSLKDVNKTSANLQSELREVNKQLKFDPKNTELLTQKQQLLTQSTQALKQKQDILKEAVMQAHSQFEKGDLGADKVRAVEREYSKVTSQLKDLDKQAGSMSGLSKATEKLGLNSQNIKTALGTVGTVVAGYLKSATDSAIEAEEKTGTLTNLLQNQGLTADDASQKIDQFKKSITSMSSYSAGEARDALQVLTEKGVSVGDALGNSSLLANVAAGSHKTLSESATLLADAYNGKTRALTALGILTKDEAKQLGDSEDSTISMTTVQERLNERFGGAAQAQLDTYAGKMKENTNQINSSKTAIGTALLPILADLADMASKILIPLTDLIKQNPQLVATILAVIAVVGILVGGLSVLNTVTGIFGITLNLAVLPTIGLVVLAIVALAAIVVLVVKNWSSISAFFANLWAGVVGAFDKAKTAVVGVLTNIWNFAQQWGPLILTAIAPVIGVPLLIIQHSRCISMQY